MIRNNDQRINNLLQTPLSIAISAGALKEVQRLIRDGSAKEIFIKGSTSHSIICTLPSARKPQSSVVIHPPLPSILPEITTIIDEGLTQYLNSQSLHNNNNQNTKEEKEEKEDEAQLKLDGFRIGDLVCLRNSLSTVYDIEV